MVEFADLAEAEVADAAIAYEAARSGLGVAFTQQVLRAARRLQEHPLAAPVEQVVADVEVRRLLVGRFSHKLVYVTAPRTVVIAVPHVRRDPLYWVSRVEEAMDDDG